MKSYLRILAPLVLPGCVAPALAQVYQYPATRPVQWFIDTGGSLTQGQTRQFFDNGWTLGTGLNFAPDPAQPFMLRAELNYSRFSATGDFLALNQAATGVPIDDGSLQTVTGFVNGVLQTPVSPWMRFYVTGGVGLGYRRIELTQNGFFCNSFFCGPAFDSNTLVASSDTTRFAWNAGLGLDFALPRGESWFLEARYERIETQPSSEFIPI
ncbi:MAG: outer membrane protein, partial [Candidatus Dormibacteria bacterium]